MPRYTIPLSSMLIYVTSVEATSEAEAISAALAQAPRTPDELLEELDIDSEGRYRLLLPWIHDRNVK